MRIKISKKYWKTDLLNLFPLAGNIYDRIINGKRSISIYTGLYTMLSLRERELLFDLAKRYSREGNILEIGCYAGGSTYFLAKGAAINNSKVFSIDPFGSDLKKQKIQGDSTSYLKNLKNKPGMKEVEKRLMDKGIEKKTFCLIEGYSKDISRKWKSENISFLWIDGNHKEAYRDFINWKGKLTKEAVVAFHDSDYPYLGKKEVTLSVKKICKKKLATFLCKRDSITVLKVKGS